MAPTARFSVAVSLFSSAIAFPPIPRQPFSSHPSALPSNCTAPTISFGSCPEEAPSQLECATYSVPINWDEPEGEKFDLGLVRLPANANSTKKIGSLSVNPGGPGSAASDLIGLTDAFDLIRLDPRGVGLSSLVQCDQKNWAERVS
jgi:hypothetical protein